MGSSNCEFVAAERATRLPCGANFKTVGDRWRARRYPRHGREIVDRLEPVEVDQHDREFVECDLAQRCFQRFGEQAAVGEAGQRIMAGGRFRKLLSHQTRLDRAAQLDRLPHHRGEGADADKEREQDQAEQMPLDAEAFQRGGHARDLGEVPATCSQRHQREEFIQLVRPTGLATRAGHKAILSAVVQSDIASGLAVELNKGGK